MADGKIRELRRLETHFLDISLLPQREQNCSYVHHSYIIITLHIICVVMMAYDVHQESERDRWDDPD